MDIQLLLSRGTASVGGNSTSGLLGMVGTSLAAAGIEFGSGTAVALGL